jgi:hypothetical protein
MSSVLSDILDHPSVPFRLDNRDYSVMLILLGKGKWYIEL